MVSRREMREEEKRKGVLIAAATRATSSSLGRRRVNEWCRQLHRRGQGSPNGKSRGKKVAGGESLQKEKKCGRYERIKMF